jgi:hypothetical protein
MVGGGFQHDICSCAHNTPKYVDWIKGNHTAPISVHIDDAVFNTPTNTSIFNVAWFAESPYFTQLSISKFDDPQEKSRILENFQLIVSCDKEFIKKHPEVKYVVPTARPWVKNQQVFPKTKWASIISSAKRNAPGHQLRHIIVDQYKENLDVFGGGYNPIDEKGIGLNDYLYSFTVENVKVDGYFTEKIADCFATGTIPVYWGDETIDDYFIENGIIRLTDGFDPDILTKELYESKLEFVRENFQRILEFPIPEDYIYQNYIK